LVIAQRLTRRLCPACKEPVEQKGLELEGIKLTSEIVYKAKGCEKCNSIGYRGRSLISEVVLFDNELRNKIYENCSIQEINKIARKKGSKSLFESGIRQVEEGITSLEEVLSVTTDFM
jgi:type II secretory ATPase GspE/PulE/Tfp pilus assembly ATPase PilB-like protein